MNGGMNAVRLIMRQGFHLSCLSQIEGKNLLHYSLDSFFWCSGISSREEAKCVAVSCSEIRHHKRAEGKWYSSVQPLSLWGLKKWRIPKTHLVCKYMANILRVINGVIWIVEKKKKSFLHASTYVVTSYVQTQVMSFYNRQLKLPALLFSCLSRFPSATFIL